MASNSRYFLPLNSRLFSKNSSQPCLSSGLPSRPYLSNRASVTETALPQISKHADEAVTTLPAQAASNPRRKLGFWRAKEAQKAQAQEVSLAPKTSVWRRMVNNIKKSFKGFKSRKARAAESHQPPPNIITISPPTDFQHLTSAAGHLRGPDGRLHLEEQEAMDTEDGGREQGYALQPHEQYDGSTILTQDTAQEGNSDADWQTEYGASRYELRGSWAQRRY